MFAILTAKADVPAVHGMLLFGQETTYASHLPMFHYPHDYQLIMELKLADLPRSQTLDAYEFFKGEGETLFTLVPEKMDLAQVISGDKTTFKALIYLGHFERGGKKLGAVSVTVDVILHSQKLDGTQPPQRAREYLVFGKKGEYFAAHMIKSKPSFDSILSVSQPHKFCNTRFCADPISTPIGDDKLPVIVADLALLPEEGTSLGFPFAITEVKKILYLEEAELHH